MKGNMLLGMARGSVGDVVYARVKGQQVAHARNRAPLNPKSEAQMMQRSLFVDVNKFFTRGTQNLFKFAFESKQAKESDFNAFMRYNMKNGVRISQKAFLEPTYPALGHFMLSQGSLKAPIVSDNSTTTKSQFTFQCYPSSTVSLSTVTQLTEALMTMYDLKVGDIVTFLVINAQGPASSGLPSVDPDVRGQITWTINQVKLSLSDTRTLATVLPDIYLTISSNNILFGIGDGISICAGAVIFSRPLASGVKASNSYLVNSLQAEAIITASQQDTYVQEVLESWGSTGTNILQGSLVV